MRIVLWTTLAVLILFLLGVPFLLSAYPKTLATEALILGLFAMSIDILAGIAGRTPLGHGSIFGVAAYVVAHRVAIIDHGRIIAQGTSQELKQQTGAESLEQAFLKLTGSTIRDEEASPADRMRQMARAWGRR